MKYFGLSLLLLLSSCSIKAPGSSTGKITNVVNCSLPKDQGEGSLQGRWASLPISIVLDKDFYVADEGEAMPSLRGAVETWNSWSSLKNKTAFNIINDGSGVSAGMDIPQLTDCSQASYSAAVTDKVGIWKISSSGDHANRRDSCGTQLKILPDGVQGQTDWITSGGYIIGSSILLNFEGFNSPGNRSIDVESLLLHELGHVLGLLHSCNGSSAGSTDGTSAPACAIAPEKYLFAVMFPFLQENQIRRDLNQNDYDRVNCLY